MLVSNIEIFQEYASVEYNFDFNTIKPFVVQVERDEVKKLIGSQMYQFFEAKEDTSETVFDLLYQAIVSLSLAKYIPQGSVFIGDNGITVSSAQNSKPAEWWQIRDLRRDLYDRGFSAIDALLEFLEENIADYPQWEQSKEHTVFKDLIVSQTKHFQDWFNINSSRRVFLAMKPLLKEVQQKYVNLWLNDETIINIKAAENTITAKAEKLLQAALVNFCVSKAVYSGGFIFGPGAIYLKYLDLPGDKSKLLSDKDKAILNRDRENTGCEFLKLLKTHIERNLDAFPNYKINEDSTVIEVYNTKSIASF